MVGQFASKLLPESCMKIDENMKASDLCKIQVLCNNFNRFKLTADPKELTRYRFKRQCTIIS